jgi:hypothetical protein
MGNCLNKTTLENCSEAILISDTNPSKTPTTLTEKTHNSLRAEYVNRKKACQENASQRLRLLTEEELLHKMRMRLNRNKNNGDSEHSNKGCVLERSKIFSEEDVKGRIENLSTMSSVLLTSQKMDLNMSAIPSTPQERNQHLFS